MRIKFVASVIAALSLAFVPTAAQAVATTLDVQNGGNAAVDLEAGDTLDVTVAGPIAKTGAATHELYSTWSTQSLVLAISNLSDPGADLTWPEGWTLEYTLDGTTWIDWSVTAPTDALDIIAIRSLGDVNTVGENMFKTTASGSLQAVTFPKAGAGDGFDVATGNGKIFNFYHHQTTSVTVECHLYNGDVCPTSTHTIPGYRSNHGSRIFFNEDTDRVYAYAYEISTGDFGVVCVDYSTDTATNCGWLSLDQVDSQNDPEGEFDHNNGYGSQSEDSNGVIWSIAGTSGRLMCFDMNTEAACPDNGWPTGESAFAMYSARVTALNGKIFYTIDHDFGCFDPATNGNCSASTPVTLANINAVHAPIPVANASGVLTGACDYSTRVCIDFDGASLTFPTALGTFWDAYPTDDTNAYYDMSQWAYNDGRLYYDTSVGATGWASNAVTCYDFRTQAACEGFDGTGHEEITLFYTATFDPSTPDCIWINQDTGLIVPLNINTGAVGCDLGDPVVELPYDAVTPRMSCDEGGRVTAWENLKVNLPTGVSMTDVRVSFYDSIDPNDNTDTSTPVTSYVDLTPDANGVIDLTGLTTDETGTQPTIRIEAGDISDSLATEITATVMFVAEDPQLCFVLDADNYCETTVVDSPPAGSIADGIVEGTSITRPNAGNDLGSKETSEIPGTYADQMCQASALSIDLPISQLASTGVDAGTIAMTGFAVVAIGGAAVAVTRRRKA